MDHLLIGGLITSNTPSVTTFVTGSPRPGIVTTPVKENVPVALLAVRVVKVTVPVPSSNTAVQLCPVTAKEKRTEEVVYVPGPVIPGTLASVRTITQATVLPVMKPPPVIVVAPPGGKGPVWIVTAFQVAPSILALIIDTSTPAWTTVNALPAIVSVPLRELPLVVLATEYATVPLPVPELPEVIVIHESLLVAVQEPEQALGEAVTVTLPVPPLAPND